MGKLADELKMSRAFALVEEEATLAILHTADLLQQRASALLKPFDVTPAQYNVLRILHGSPKGLGCGAIAERLVTNDPDVTRLLDRMEARTWLERKRSEQDRRVVMTCLTVQGRRLLERVNPVIAEYNRQQYLDWDEKQLRQLIDLLEKVRSERNSESVNEDKKGIKK